jgi:hypothetical protein
MITFREWQKINESYDQSLGVKSAQSVVNPNLSAFYDILEAKKKAMKKKMELDGGEELEDEKPLDSTGDGETVKPKSEKDLPKKDDEKGNEESPEDEESSDDELRDKMDDEDSDESDESSDKKLFMKKKMKKDEKCDDKKDKKEKKEEKDKKDEKCDDKKVKKEDVEFLQSLSKMMELPKSYNYENLEELPKIDPITGYVIK